MELRLCNPFRRIIPLPSNFSYQITSSSRPPFLSVRSSHLDSNESRKLVLEVKEKLEKNHQSLPVGKNGRDDEDLILWFLKDRKFSVQESVEKLHKAIVRFCSVETVRKEYFTEATLPAKFRD